MRKYRNKQMKKYGNIEINVYVEIEIYINKEMYKNNE